MEKYLLDLKNAIFQKGYNYDYCMICLKYARRLLDNNLPVIFDLEHFKKLTGANNFFIRSIIFSSEKFYSTTYLKKKNGGYREINNPSYDLKHLQKWILTNILENINVSEYAKGFIKENSILDNAQIHTNQECVINLDIEDFFGSIKFEKIFNVFYYFGYTKELSFFLARICTYKESLPQGAPTSPALSNIVCLRLDKRLSLLAKSYQSNYSRYADDITFSGNSGIEYIIEISKKILEEEKLNVNINKVRVKYYYQRQEVTGLNVNGKKVRVNKAYKRKLLQEIYYCKKYGVSSHLNRIKSDKSFYKEHLYGKAYFVKMIENDLGKKIISELDKIEWDY